MAELSRVATALLCAKRDAARNAAVTRAIDEVRASQLWPDDLPDRSSLVGVIKSWMSTTGERLASAIQHFDLGISPQLAGVMGQPGRVRVTEDVIDLSRFEDTGWESEARLRIGAHSVELLLKPLTGTTERDRLVPRMALYDAAGQIIFPDVTQMSRPAPDGHHVFLVWQGQGERADHVLAVPLSAEVWFVERFTAAQE